MDIKTQVPTNGGSWLAQFGDHWRKQLTVFNEKLGSVLEKSYFPGEYPTDVPILMVKRSAIVDVLTFLQKTPGFEYSFLADITATDEESEPRFEVVYQLFSLSFKNRIRVKVKVGSNETVPTAVSVWPGANWAEREVFDMFGIRFEGHPDLRRILMDNRWEGHPLRKDYPLRGYQIFTDSQEIDPSLLS
jgi:NADH-quinone oxidoreductase subunit C